MEMELPPEVRAKYDEQLQRERYNPVATEKVEGNLRMTKVRRTIPITSHYYSNAEGRGNANR